MNINSKATTAAAFLAAAFLVVPGLPANATTASSNAGTAKLVLNKPMAGSTMFFADRYATAYYLIDKSNFKTVVTVAPGRNGEGNPMQFVNSLSDGESAEYSVGGYGSDAIKVKLMLHRDGNTVKADVSTEVPQSGS